MVREFLGKNPRTFTQHFGTYSSGLCQTWERKDVAKRFGVMKKKILQKFSFNQGEEFQKAERKQFGSNSAPSGKIPPLSHVRSASNY